ncbi:MAG: homoserine kinase [Limnochordia bacterium]
MVKHQRVKIRVPATTANLGSGFDSVGMALEIFNEFQFEVLSGSQDEVEVEGAGAEELPRDSSNLVLQSARAVFDHLGKKTVPLGLRINNEIPLARGLGSSATAIVGGLLGANALLGDPLTKEELIRMATEIEGHPDNVAPALLGGIVVSFQGSQRVWTQRIDPPSNCGILLVIPRFHLSTSDARAALPAQVDFADAIFNVGRVAYLVATLSKGSLQGIGEAMEDRLHQPYRQRLIPGLEEVFAAARRGDATGVALSGAGPSVLVIGEEDLADLGRELQGIFAQAGIESDVIQTRPWGPGAICFIQ